MTYMGEKKPTRKGLNLFQYYEIHGPGCLTRLQLDTGISYSTIHRARKGKGINFDLAEILSNATQGELGITALCRGFKAPGKPA